MRSLFHGALGIMLLGPAPAVLAQGTPPAPLTRFVSEFEGAANRRDVKAVLALYAPEFRHRDGYDRQNLGTYLEQLWTRFPNLTSRTEVLSWRPQGNGWNVETRTTLQGTETLQGRPFTLKSTLRSRQYLEQGRILRQETLAEESQLSAGRQPPAVTVQLPTTVRVGQPYAFDVILQEPLRGEQALGIAQVEPVKPALFSQPAPLNLEVLPSGGLFKVGKAPALPQDQWLSAVVVRGEGMILVSRRLVVRH